MSIRVGFLFLTGIILAIAVSCNKADTGSGLFPSKDFIKTGSYLGEYFPTTQWRECNPEEVDMNDNYIKDLNNEIVRLVESGVDMHGILITRKGYIVAEQYYSIYFDKNTEHVIHSCTKSFTSALFGIALSEGYIAGIDARMVDYFPEYDIENLTNSKKDIMLEHMLTMSSGLDWDELDFPYSDPRNTYYQWRNSDDHIQFILDRPMEYSPGEIQNYNSGLSDLLSVIIQKTTGVRTDSFAIEKLFNPLGIDDFYWPVDVKDYAMGGGGMRMNTRDMARFGFLYLNEGQWDGKQILPAEWVGESQEKHLPFQHISNYYYGYQFWISSFGMYAAVGYGGQWIMILPDYELVVVFINNFEESNGEQWNIPERLVRDYIIPSVNGT
jgi:CubicO group peptidase (beta-lactamase class C family)